MSRFVINSLGECFLQHEKTDDFGDNVSTEIGSGSINVVRLARNVLTEEDFGFWYGRYEHSTPHTQALEAYVQRCIRHQFFINAYEDMTPDQFMLYLQWNELNVLDDGQFRVWCEHNDGEEPKVWLVTEFCYWTDQQNWWDNLHQIAEQNGFEINLMHESEHVDKSHTIGVNGVLPDFSNCTDENANYGENHGRMERQVEFRKNVYGKSLDEVKAIREQVHTITADVWAEAGVAVC